MIECMRLVVIDDIDACENDRYMMNENEKIHHGGYANWGRFVQNARSCGLEVVRYYKGFGFNSDDIIYFQDRKLLHFYKGWRILKKNKLLDRTIAVLIESDVVDRKCGIKILKQIGKDFRFIMTYHDDLVDDICFFKIWPYMEICKNEKTQTVPYIEKGLLALISSNIFYNETPGENYSERKKIVEWFENNSISDFKVYGRGWDDYSCWGGVIGNKEEVYNRYRFALCIENSCRNGYITEKIFDCFNNKIVPIYLGALNIDKYIPKGCYIDYNKFNSAEELLQYLKTIDLYEYNKYITQIDSFLNGENITHFMDEEQYSLKKIVDILNKEDRAKKKYYGFRLFIFVYIHEYYLLLKNNIYEMITHKH